MSPTDRLDVAGQDAASGAAPSSVTSMGSGGDDRPSENISLNFGRIDDKPSDTQGNGSGDDRPSENISLNFGRIDDKSSGAAGVDNDGNRPSEELSLSFTKLAESKSAVASSPASGGADDFVLEPGAAGAEESSGLLDFSGIGGDARAEGEEFFTFDAPAVPPPEGDSNALSAFEAAHADPTGDRIEDIVAAPRPAADDFIA
ncbi:hypothetical protein [Ancylobacter vacuolatus]|uniref:Uncharacterized protein n=1 Tax=Ancylobacter vacuolatus TaxID=223389 RepID=A0ABU0DGT6_9HYPH|nr:hypothetical protein [Ancylobacter vacuolatus]MDQ0347622.1 hypothetical protein [Ancylobacter vacuolatus]